MGFFKKLAGLLTPAVQEDPNAVYVYVKCNRCGEKLRARISTRSELSPVFGNTDNADSFYCRKVLIGEKLCFQPIEINLKFDTKYRFTDRQISGGEFITQEEYEAD
jgi:hypothetical protein